jgi:iron complex transport system substrate-binding protein
MNINIKKHPKRIICLTEETTETLYSIGAGDLIAGVTAYTKRPSQAIKEKPVVARYIDAKIDDIIELKPDIVFTWSDLQADISAQLIKEGIEVYAFNHRSVEGILAMIYKVGALVGKPVQAEQFADKLKKKIDDTLDKSSKIQNRPKVYFEEWYNPLISGIRWVSEIIEICGGDDIFVKNRQYQNAKPRIIDDNSEVIRRNPDIILASWCGKPFKEKKMLERDDWQKINAVKNKMIFEIDSAIILQPGPAPIVDGIDIITKIIGKWQDSVKK